MGKGSLLPSLARGTTPLLTNKEKAKFSQFACPLNSAAQKKMAAVRCDNHGLYWAITHTAHAPIEAFGFWLFVSGKKIQY